MTALPSQPGPAPATAARKRILIVDDHALIRCGCQMVIAPEDDLEVCGEAACFEEALLAVDQTHPDIVITDIAMPGRDGLELIKELQDQHPGIPVLVVSMLDERLYGERVFKAGASGYLMKESAPEELVTAVRQVLSGQPYMSSSLSKFLMGRFAHPGSGKFPLDRLTDRELEVFRLLGKGLSRRKIASQLKIEPRTVEAHCAHIRTKLELDDGHDLLRFAVRWEQSTHSRGD